MFVLPFGALGMDGNSRCSLDFLSLAKVYEKLMLPMNAYELSYAESGKAVLDFGRLPGFPNYLRLSYSPLGSPFIKLMKFAKGGVE